jgi:hypothetical protein
MHLVCPVTTGDFDFVRVVRIPVCFAENRAVIDGGDRVMPRLGLRRGQRGEYLLLVAFDALRAGHNRD